MLWACLLLPSLPLDVFARAAPDDAQRPFVVASGGHYPRVVAANGCAHAAGIRRDQLSGIVADSVPETEYQEVLAKSAILRRALELAKEGL